MVGARKQDPTLLSLANKEMYALDLPLILPTLHVSLAVTSPGLISSPFHIITTGYAGSIAAIGAWNLATKVKELGFPLASLLHNVAMMLFGVRLGTYLHLRSQTDSYKARDEITSAKEKMKKMSITSRVMFWMPCAALYAMMATPALATTISKTEIQLQDPLFASGLAMMIAGGILEAVADYHKTSLKKRQPTSFASTGVFTLCRHPSYLGEVMFWVGNYIAGLPAIGLDWRFHLLAASGLMGIMGIMFGASKSLAKRQNDKYGDREDWKKYTAKVKGTLFPKLV